MKTLYLPLLFSLLSASLQAQIPDFISTKYDSLLKLKPTRLDTISDRLNDKIDSVQGRVNNFLNPDLKKRTSRVQRRKPEVPDSIKAVQELNTMKAGLTHKIDSLKGLNLSTESYTRRLDSLNKISPTRYIQIAQQKADQWENKINEPANNLTQTINKPLDQLEDKVNDPIKNIEGRVNEKLDLLKKEGGEGANLPGNLETKGISAGNVSIPGLDVNTNIPGQSGLKLPGTDRSIENPLGKIDNVTDKVPGLDGLKEKTDELKSNAQGQLEKVKSMDEVQNVKEKVGNINGTTDKIQSYGNDAKSIANGNVGEVKEIPNTIENKVKSLDELKELEKQSGELAKVKGMLDQGKDPEALKQMAKKEIIEKAQDHFAGKTEVLAAAMEKVSKLKSKYSDVKSLADLPKRVPNPMKGKPLIERFVPGVTTQIQKIGNFMIDISPVLSYRFTGRLNAGLGWNERFSFAKWNKLNSSDHIYGPRAFGSFAFRKGFALKAEIEKMNSVIPPFSISPDAGSRQWVWSAFVGMKKDYKFAGKVNGNVQVLYNIYDDHDNSPYMDRINVRMGFEFPMKKKRKNVGK